MYTQRPYRLETGVGLPRLPIIDQAKSLNILLRLVVTQIVRCSDATAALALRGSFAKIYCVFHDAECRSRQRWLSRQTSALPDGEDRRRALLRLRAHVRGL